jgi:hypothetical protein
MIAFSLPWFVYLIMYFLIGVLSLVMIGTFMVYHRFVTRKKNQKFPFFQYLKNYAPPGIVGLVYVAIPELIYIIVIGFLFAHSFMSFNLKQFFCEKLSEDY